MKYSWADLTIHKLCVKCFLSCMNIDKNPPVARLIYPVLVGMAAVRRFLSIIKLMCILMLPTQTIFLYFYQIAQVPNSKGQFKSFIVLILKDRPKEVQWTEERSR